MAASKYSIFSVDEDDKRKKDLLDSILKSANTLNCGKSLATKVECLKQLLEQMVPIAQLHSANFTIGSLSDELAQLRLQMKDMLIRVDIEKPKLQGQGAETRFPFSVRDLEELRWKVAETEAQAAIISHQLTQEREANSSLRNILTKVCVSHFQVFIISNFKRSASESLSSCPTLLTGLSVEHKSRPCRLHLLLGNAEQKKKRRSIDY
jgi:hypothetical protein